MTNKKIIISFDLSLNSPAVAIYQNNQFLHIETLKQKQKLSAIEKINNIYSWISDLLIKYNPDICLIEHNLFNHNNTKNKTLITLGSINVLCQLLCFRHNVPVELIYPCSWKSKIKRSFNIDKLEKNDTIKLMNNYYGINLKTNDEGDACSLIWYYLEVNK